MCIRDSVSTSTYSATKLTVSLNATEQWNVVTTPADPYRYKTLIGMFLPEMHAMIMLTYVDSQFENHTLQTSGDNFIP